MPGIIYHLSFAEEVYRNINKPINNVEFFSGNLIPDLVIDKKLSHYRIPASTPGFEVPDMGVVKSNLYDINNAINIGMYCHLYLDYHLLIIILFLNSFGMLIITKLLIREMV